MACIRTGADEVDVVVDVEKMLAPGHQVRFEGFLIRPLRAGSVDCSLCGVVVAARADVETLASHPWHVELE